VELIISKGFWGWCTNFSLSWSCYEFSRFAFFLDLTVSDRVRSEKSIIPRITVVHQSSFQFWLLGCELWWYNKNGRTAGDGAGKMICLSYPFSCKYNYIHSKYFLTSTGQWCWSLYSMLTIFNVKERRIRKLKKMYCKAKLQIFSLLFLHMICHGI